MRLSNYFYKSQKNTKENLPNSLNRLIRGCFVSQEATGIVRFLPLGLKVLKKLTKLIEDHMNTIAIQVELPFLQSVDLWKASGRYDTYGKETLRLKDRNHQEFLIPPTCEEAIIDLTSKVLESYKDLPKSIYQITWKFRDEMRPRAGLLRGRLFLMKDSYSFARTEAEAHRDYMNHYNVYVKICEKLKLEVYTIQADSGEIGGDLSHEFVIKTSEGDGNGFLYKPATIVSNIEEIKAQCGTFHESLCDENKKYANERVMEIGHIFYYDTKYSLKTNTSYTNQQGKKTPYYGGCYGIGVTRLMGLISMQSYWPFSIAPFEVHMLSIANYEQEGINLYNILSKSLDILYDDRKLSFGEKKQDMILIGIPLRLIVGKSIEFYFFDEQKFFSNQEEFIRFIHEYIQNIKNS